MAAPLLAALEAAGAAAGAGEAGGEPAGGAEVGVGEAGGSADMPAKGKRPREQARKRMAEMNKSGAARERVRTVNKSDAARERQRAGGQKGAVEDKMCASCETRKPSSGFDRWQWQKGGDRMCCSAEAPPW
eukprot:gene37274-3830_t